VRQRVPQPVEVGWMCCSAFQAYRDA
jgi:hypothetical protein